MKLFKESGHTVVLVSERGAEKHYDAIMDDGQTLELKTVTGNLSQIGRRFKDGIKKADNVFIRTAGKTPKEIYLKLIGETKTLLENGANITASGSVFLWIDDEGKMHDWSIKRIVEQAKKLL